MKICASPICKDQVPPPRRKFCSNLCLVYATTQSYYKRNIEKIKADYKKESDKRKALQKPNVCGREECSNIVKGPRQKKYCGLICRTIIKRDRRHTYATEKRL